MKIQQLIDEQIDQFSKRFAVRLMELGSVDEITYQSIVRSEGKSFFNSLTRQLIEAVGEELIGSNQQIVMGNSYTNIETEANNDFRDKQRLKLKEIISS